MFADPIASVSWLGHNPRVTSSETEPPVDRRSERAGRPESREIKELRELKNAQPDLAAAADMQIELLGAQRRIQSRVPVPSTTFDRQSPTTTGASRAPVQRHPHRLVRFSADAASDGRILRRFETLDTADYDRLQALAETPRSKPLSELGTEPRRPLVPAPRPGLARSRAPGSGNAALDASISGPLRRGTAAAARARHRQQPHCPLCGASPNCLHQSLRRERLLICSRCTGQWCSIPITCPFCENKDRLRITSFTSRDGR